MLIVYAFLIVLVPGLAIAGISAWAADRKVMRWFAEVDRDRGRMWHHVDGELYTTIERQKRH
jgi:hypothetical protein